MPDLVSPPTPPPLIPTSPLQIRSRCCRCLAHHLPLTLSVRRHGPSPSPLVPRLLLASDFALSRTGACFPCFGSSNKEGSGGGGGAVKEVTKKDSVKEGSVAQSYHVNRVSLDKSKSRNGSDHKKEPSIPKDGSTAHIVAQTFTFQELAAATKNFISECLLGEGGFGRVYKGCLESSGQVVAIKQLNQNGLQGNREFLVEVLMLSLLHHPNLVSLIVYCDDRDQRLLVYEFMPLGS